MLEKEKIIQMLIEWPVSICTSKYSGVDYFGEHISVGDRIFWIPKDILSKYDITGPLTVKLQTYVEKFHCLPEYTRMGQSINQNNEFNVPVKSFKKSVQRFGTDLSDIEPVDTSLQSNPEDDIQF